MFTEVSLNKIVNLYIDHYKKITTSDMNESMDNVYRLLKNL